MINNSAAASAAAAGFPIGAHHCPRRQPVGAHVALFLFTCGPGNALYAWYKAAQRCMVCHP